VVSTLHVGTLIYLYESADLFDATSAYFVILQAINLVAGLTVQWYTQISNGSTSPCLSSTQGKAKKTRKFAQVKRMLNPNDIRLYAPCFERLTILITSSHIYSKENQAKQQKKEQEAKEKAVRRMCVPVLS
jgi:hypothetical protein